MNKSIFLIHICLVGLTACAVKEEELEPQTLQLSATSLNTWAGLCNKIELSLRDVDGASVSSGYLRTINVSADFGDLYSNAACTQKILSITLSPDGDGTSVYYSSPSAATPTIKISSSGLPAASISLIVTDPAAELVLGQATFADNTLGTSSQAFQYPTNSVVAGDKLVVADYYNSRILIWNTIPTSNQQAADVVVGQANMTSSACNAGGISAQTLCYPSSVHSDGTRLVVSDEGNHRVLIWTTIPSTNGEAADLVLGQPDMISNNDNQGAGPTATSLSYPACVWISGSHLFVADGANNRVLIWNSFPTSNAAAANVVMGQANMTSNTNGVSATAFDYPYMVSVHNNKVYVSDFVNNRVVVWNNIPSANATAASVVIGQPNMNSKTANNSGVGANTLFEPGGVAVDEQGRLYVVDFSNNRILVWNQTPTTNGSSASMVLGQTDFTSNAGNQGGAPSESSLFSPWGITTHDGKLWISDFGNHRVLSYAIP